MASELYVETLKGLTSGANANKIVVPSDQTLIAPGHVIQVVQSVKTDTASTASTSFTDITDLSVSITPSSTSNKILIQLNLGSVAISPNAVIFNLVRGATTIAQPDSGSSKGTLNIYPGGTIAVFPGAMTWLDSPATTTATTYKVQWRVDASTAYLNRHAGNADYTCVSSITVMEIAG